MASRRENYAYTVSGLPSVTLVAVEVRRCGSCGEHEVVIPRVDELHRTIALAVVAKRARLTGSEVRFLRRYLGWSGADFARHMGVTPESVSRWENEREPIGPVADRLVRLMVAVRTPASEYPLEVLVGLDAKAAPLRLRLESTRGRWLARAAA